MTLRVSLLASIFACLIVATGQCQSTKLSKDEEVAIAAYLNILRSCFLPDGAISMTACGAGPASPVWIAPYFGDHVALALLAAHDQKRNANDLMLVRKWIEWRVVRQDQGGFWNDHTGTNAGYQSNGKVDAHDSSAAMFLLVLERYQRAGGKITNTMRASAKSCLSCIRNVTDEDGLTWAKPEHKVKFLMDNIEVHAGLTAAETVFRSTDNDVVQACRRQAEMIGEMLPKYEGAKNEGLYAWALHPNGSYDGGLDELYPHGLAQLFAISFVKADVGLLDKVVSKFAPETGPSATGAERYLISAAQIGGTIEQQWRRNVLSDQSLLKPETYSFRPALATLGLCEGANWMPKR